MRNLLISSAIVLATACTFNVASYDNFSDFRTKLGIPPTLSRFLDDKKIDIAVKEVERLKVNVEKSSLFGENQSAYGAYYGESNAIELVKNYRRENLYHEIGHSLWDLIGNDGVFDVLNYEGPSRERFMEVLNITKEFKRQKGLREDYEDKEAVLQRAYSEAFAVNFKGWFEGKSTIPGFLFERMRYNGRGLKQ